MLYTTFYFLLATSYRGEAACHLLPGPYHLARRTPYAARRKPRHAQLWSRQRINAFGFLQIGCFVESLA
jgi:hypothetical protein